MKKVIITLIASLIAFAASAQSIISGLSVGAGYVNEVNKITMKDYDERWVENFNGYYIGVDYTAEKLMGPIDLTVGLAFKNLFNVDKDNSSSITTVTSNSFYDLSIPVRFGYSYDFGICKAFAFAGPKADFILDATEKITTTVNGTKTTTTESMYKSNSDLTHFQLYLGVGVGVQFLDNYKVSFTYDGGLLNRVKGYTRKDLGVKWRNPSQITLGFAYCF